MKRMKTFFIYLILFLLLYVFVNVMTYLNLRATLKDIENGGIEFKNPSISIERAQASRVNAIIKGKIRLNENQTVQYKYIRVDLLSERDNILNTKFINVSELSKDKENDFAIRTNTENVKKFKITLTDIKDVNEIDVKAKEIRNVLVGALFIWMII